MKKKLFAVACFCLLAFPFTSSAGIVYNREGSGGNWTLTTTPLVGTTPTFTMDLPGDASVTGFQDVHETFNYFRMATTDGMSGAVFSTHLYNYTYSFFDTLNLGQTWSNLSGGTNQAWGDIALMYNEDEGPGQGDTYQTGSPMYIPFKFNDTTAGGAERYGYLQLGVTAMGGAGNPTSTLTLTYNGWAYETDGTPIEMGPIPVPEPSTVLLLLAAGAFAGVRFIRKKKC